MVIKDRNIERLNKKVKDCENKKVIKYLNKCGYECSYSKASMLEINRKIRDEGKCVRIYRENQKLQKIGNYYKYQAQLHIKIEEIKENK